MVDYILAGDIFQANISQRFLAELPDGLDAFDLYRRLRARNPAPFAAYLDFGDVGDRLGLARALPASCDGRRVETRPIKGTRPRGADARGGRARSARSCCASEKDRAENVMIVDLLRNDLVARLPRPHASLTPEICALESFATVHHLVSTVTGELRAGLRRGRPPARDLPRRLDHRRAQDPGHGDHRRARADPRAGPIAARSAGSASTAAMDTSIPIRTFAIKGRPVTFQAGGGIVADSEPAAEYEETLAKARALIEALRGTP